MTAGTSFFVIVFLFYGLEKYFDVHTGVLKLASSKAHNQCNIRIKIKKIRGQDHDLGKEVPTRKCLCVTGNRSAYNIVQS